MALQHLRSSTADKRPTPGAMSDGQLAMNTNLVSPGLFLKDSNGDLVKVGPVHVGTTAPNATPGAGGQAGNSKGEQWLDTSSSRYVFKIWDGTAWRTEDGEFVNVSGDTMTGALGIIAGSAAAPGVFFSGDTNTGIYSPGADQLAVATNGTGRLFVDASGNVGVGTAPSQLFHIAGASATALLAASSGVGTLRLTRSSTTADLSVSTTLATLATTSATDFAFSTNNTERLRITAAGLVGIGTSSPTSLLALSHTASTAYSQNTEGLTLRGTSGVVNRFTSINFDGSGYAGNVANIAGVTTTLGTSYVNSAGALRFATKNTIDAIPVDRLTITAAGNVGIGTTSPAVNLHVKDSTTGRIRIEGGSTYSSQLQFLPDAQTNPWVITCDPSRNLIFFDHASERARIDSSGRLLVGTSTARDVAGGSGYTPRFQVVGNTAEESSALTACVDGAAYIAIANLGGGSVVSNNEALGFINFKGNDSNSYPDFASIAAYVDGTPGDNDAPGRLVFSVTQDGQASPTERLRVNSAGASLFFSSADGIRSAVSASAGTSTAIFWGRHSATSTSNGTDSIFIWSNGNVVNTNGSYTTISDAKLKENIVDAGSQWDDFKAIRIRNWNFKAETGHETHRQIGPIAQELETVCPGLVFETLDRDEDGNETGEVTKGVNQSVLYMKAVKALQEAMERIEQLETSNADLLARVTALESA